MKRNLLGLSVISVLLANSAFADQSNDKDWMIRIRGIHVIPQVESQVSAPSLGTVDAGKSTVPELDITKFFTKNIAAELILATTQSKLKTTNGTDLGKTWILPPTLTLQYHFTNWPQYIEPYVGAGINYTMFYNSNTPSALNNVSYTDSLGAALQVGADIPLKDNWYFNVDAKKLYVSTVAKFNDSAVRANVNLNPWIIGAGIGYRF